MKFVFECEDEVMLPALFGISEDVEKFAKETGIVSLRENGNLDFRSIMKKICVDYPKEAGNLTKKLWVLEDGESAPNCFVTMSKIVSCEGVIDFFTVLLDLGVKLSAKR